MRNDSRGKQHFSALAYDFFRFLTGPLFVQGAVHWLRLGVETTGAVVIGLGVAIALVAFARSLLARKPADFNAIRLVLARYLAMALEFQLGADILSTAVAPSWNEIGKLAAVAVIRTGLNYFLSREMQEERRTAEGERAVVAKAIETPG